MQLANIRDDLFGRSNPYPLQLMPTLNGVGDLGIIFKSFGKRVADGYVFVQAPIPARLTTKSALYIN